MTSWRRQPDRRVIDRLGHEDRRFNHDGWRWALHCLALRFFRFLFATLICQFAGLLFRPFHPFLGLADVFRGGVRRCFQLFRLDSRWRGEGGIGHMPRAVPPFIQWSGMGGLPDESGKQQGKGMA